MTQTSKEEKEPRPKRWSASRKMEIVTRYMRGETLDSLSREIGMPSAEIEKWHQRALKGIEISLKNREKDPLQNDLNLAKKQIGELSMENELLREKSKKQGVFWGGRW